MVRNVLGSLIALVGATAAVWSPFRPWYDGRHGSDVRIEDLFHGITGNAAALFGSILLPMAFAALLTLIGVALRSRVLVALAGLVVLGFTILWMVRQGQAASELTAGARGLGVGVANALGGGALMLLGALIMRGRNGRAYDRGYDRRDDDRRPGGRRYDDYGYDDHGYDERYYDGHYGRYAPDGRHDARTPYPPVAYPPGTPEPWDAGRPGAEEWDPEPYVAGSAGPPTRPVTRPYGEQDDTPTAPLPVTEPPPTGQRPRPAAPDAGQQPQEGPPTMPSRRLPPTPPVEWGREYRRPQSARPQQPQEQQPQEHRPEEPEGTQRPPEERE
ncbi:hypothetical protein AB0C96_26600 [Streptomyces sp. NPDC048506]|uniref:hypothetical protein n=1 Tax=Streptomyces sp. NPDC048506 TaxID=3155028 RepID=UPI0034350090